MSRILFKKYRLLVLGVRQVADEYGMTYLSMAFCQGIGCRKRAHSEPDDCEECMPISKRINKLHIRHSPDGWDEVENEAGQNISYGDRVEHYSSNLSSNNRSGLCREPVDPRHGYINRCQPVQIPGLPLSFSHYTHSFPTPDINHNNPLLSPMPRQPCPSSIAARQHSSDGYCHDFAESREHDNPYYHINSTLYQAHMERLQRVRQGLPPMLKLS